MAKPTVWMVYSAMTEAQTLRQFEAGAAEAAREGYEPVSQTWDGTTLMVTYALRSDAGASESSDYAPATRASGADALHWPRPAVASVLLLLLGLLAVAAAVVWNGVVRL